MSIGCNLGTSFNMKHIYNYLTLSNDDIIAIKSSEGIRCIEELKSKFKSTNKNSKKNFYNQNTIIMCIGADKFINIKLFNCKNNTFLVEFDGVFDILFGYTSRC